MSTENELKEIEYSVMEKIHSGKVKMRPKIFFIGGSILIFLGLFLSIISSSVFISLVKFILRSNGKISYYGIEQLENSFPWILVFLAIGSIAIGVLMLKQYDFSYKKNFWVIIIIFITSVTAAGYLLDEIRFNEYMIGCGPNRIIKITISEESTINNDISRFKSMPTCFK